MLFSFNQNNKFSSPVKYLSNKNVSYLSETSNNKYRYSVSANEEGDIFVFSNFLDTQEKFKFTFGESIENFRITNNNISLLADFSIVEIWNGNNKFFAKLKKIDFNNNYNFFAKSKLLNQYLLYNESLNLTHKIDIEKDKRTYQDFYFNKDILSISSYDSNYVIFSSSDDSTFLSEVNNFDNLSNTSFSFLTSDSILTSSIEIIEDEIYFWSAQEGKLFFNSFSLSNKKNNTGIELTDSEVDVHDLTEIKIQKQNSVLITFLIEKEKLSAAVYDGNLEKFSIVNEEKEDDSKFVSNIIYYDNIFYWYDIDTKGKKIYTRKFIESQNVNSYFVTSFYNGNKFLVYQNNSDNTINFVNIE